MFFQEEKKFNFEDERNSRWPWQTTQGLWARVWTHFAYSEENKHISKLNRKSKWLHYFFFLIPIFHTRSNGKRTATARPWLNPAARLRLFLKVDVDSGLNPVEQGWEEAAGGQPQPTAVSLTFHYHAVISVEMSGEGGQGWWWWGGVITPGHDSVQMDAKEICGRQSEAWCQPVSPDTHWVQVLLCQL